ncbi:hypothetical protein BGZ72_001363 [Mortierella alpina]|nr:hypothetical protein BGZ72_001363 [Mortierella alpina]
MSKQDMKVLIVGAGLGGLMLATLLERAGVAYEIFERAAEVKPLGSALSLGANVFYIFKQLGLLDELRARAKPFGHTRAYAEGCNTVRVRDYSPANEIAGFLPHIIARPDLYSLLQGQIPGHKLHHSKRVLSVIQGEDGVSITCADKSTYKGTILVGADGAYSSIRQRLYQQLQEQGILPESDQDSDQLPFSSVCLVGQTRVLDQPEDRDKFGKVMAETFSRFDVTVGDRKPYTWVTFTTKQNTLCWMIIQHLDKESARSNDSFRNSEWGPESAQLMCEEVKGFPLLNYPGLTIADLINETEQNLISKVMLEEKLFETWYSGRVMHPSAGLGAVSAIHDAVVLANVLHDLPTSEPGDITSAFKSYREERYPLAKISWDTSHKLSTLLGNTFVNVAMRFLLNQMPRWIWTKVLTRMYGYRPQVSFLPLAKDLGAVPPAPQLSLKSIETKAI